jgi:hypothetical protein
VHRETEKLTQAGKREWERGWQAERKSQVSNDETKTVKHRERQRGREAEGEGQAERERERQRNRER